MLRDSEKNQLDPELTLENVKKDSPKGEGGSLQATRDARDYRTWKVSVME